MLSKRLVGVITVKDGWAVQSFGYRSYLPLGRPEVLAENLDRWGVDEILLQCIDRSRRSLGPDLELLARVAAPGLSTPLIYSGGIASVEDAVAAVRAGADRICVDALLHDKLSIAAELAIPLGAQAVIAALPLSMQNGDLLWLDYRDGSTRPLPPELDQVLNSGLVSEALVIDHVHEGQPERFEPALVERLDLPLPLICFGGISGPEQIADLLATERVTAVAIGNFLAYREHAVQAYRAALDGLPVREPVYERTLTFS